MHYDFTVYITTTKYSGRMRAAHLPTTHASVATRYQHLWRGPQVNKFEQVSKSWSPDVTSRGPSGEQVWTGLHSWPPDITSRVGVGLGVPEQCGPISRALGWDEDPCLVRSNASWVMVTWGLHPRGQTERTENITSMQLRWQAVKNTIYTQQATLWRFNKCFPILQGHGDGST